MKKENILLAGALFAAGAAAAAAVDALHEHGFFKKESQKKEPELKYRVCSALNMWKPHSDKKIMGANTHEEGIRKIADYLKKEKPSYMYYKIIENQTDKVIWKGDSWGLQQQLREMGDDAHKDTALHNAQTILPFLTRESQDDKDPESFTVIWSQDSKLAP